MDVDLWSGGVSEKPLPGSMIGPTFACVIATQMSYIRSGDRFWYELPNQPSSFTPGTIFHNLYSLYLLILYLLTFICYQNNFKINLKFSRTT